MNDATIIVVLTPDEYKRDMLIPGTIARPAYMEGKVLYEIKWKGKSV